MRIDPEHHDGTSDATPGGEDGLRRPGELGFAIFLLLASLVLIREAWGIENSFGPNGLSSPRSIPLATSCVMVISAALVLLKTLRLPQDRAETLMRDILPWTVILFVGLLVTFGIALKPIGFLPVSALFLIVSIKVLSRRGWGWTIGISLVALLAIWLIFRIVFSVLMPAGIIPEAELVQFLRSMMPGGAK